MLKTVLAMVLSLMSVVLMAAGELDVARQALRDGLWEIARLHAGTNASEEARLVVLESYAGEGKWEDVAKTLEAWPDAKGVGFDYYRAVVRRDHAAALAALKKTGAPEGLVEAKLHEAEALARDGNRSGAETLWRDLLATTNVGERVLAHASANLMDSDALRRAYAEVKSVSLRRMVGLRLGVALLREKKTAAEGERLIREIVRDSPDAGGARDAFLALADGKLSDGDWKGASDAYREAVEIWPDAARVAAVQEGRGWALQKQGRLEDALEAFRQAGVFAADDAAKATALLKEGDVLSELGRIEAAMEKYREVSEKYPKTTVAEKLKAVLRIREQEAEGRRLYREFRYGDAMAAFARVAEADSSRRPRMSYFSMLCLYGQGYDEEALAKARDIVATCPDPRHLRQGFSMTDPSPPHVGHVCRTWKNPLPPMTTPLPPQVLQVTRFEPSAAPVPLHSGHCTGRVSSIVRSLPKIASSKSMSRRNVMSSPRRGAFGSAARRERPPPPPKKPSNPPNPPPPPRPPKMSPNMEKMSSMFMPPAPKPPAPPGSIRGQGRSRSSPWFRREES